MMKRNQLRPSLGINLSTRLAMTPSLLQKIELLTLNHLELSEMLNQELAENPVLEEQGAQDSQSSETDPENPETASDESSASDEVDQYEDFDYEYFFGEYLGSGGSQYREREIRDDQPSFDRFLATSLTLSHHLNWQLTLDEIPAEILEIAYFIVGNIDEDGYLEVTVEEIAEALSVSPEQVEEALKRVQRLDPIGVGSRDLRECLLIQLEGADLQGSLPERLVRDYLPQVQAKKFRELASELDCDLEEIASAMDIIRGLSPKPGEKYGGESPRYVQPDVHIRKAGEDYEIVLNNEGLPKLRLSAAYRELLKKKNVSKDTKSFVRERFRSAMELLKSVDQRQETIYRACKAIVSRQRGFLDHGISKLKPMLIKDVAEELGVHSSTVSRVVSNKHAHTPQGVIELRKFFTSGITSSDGEDLSVVQVKEKIKKIISGENGVKPYSDQKISKMLNQDGIQITRRTVAKYRDQMNISGSRERKTTSLI